MVGAVVCENHGTSFMIVHKKRRCSIVNIAFIYGLEIYFAKLTARVSRITVIFTCPG